MKKAVKLSQKTNGLLNFQDYKKAKYRVVYGIIIFVLVLAVLTALIPIFWLLITSFKTTDELYSNIYHYFQKCSI